MARMPRKVKVGYAVYTIEEDPLLYAATSSAGATGPDDQAIRIATNLAFETARQVLFHEIGHAVWNQTLLDRKMNDDEEEDVMWALFPLLLGVLRDNPKLVEWLMEAAP